MSKILSTACIYGTFEANFFFTSLFSLQKGKIQCIHAMQCVYMVRSSKKHIIFYIVYIIVAPLCSAFLKRIHFNKAHGSEKRGVL